MKLRTTLMAAAVMVTMATAANAAAITGSFSISGGPVVLGNPAVTVDQSNSLTFGPVTTYVAGAAGTTLGGLAACAGTCGTGGTLTISPFSASTPLFTLTNGLSFDLTSVTNVTRVAATAANPIAKLIVDGSILLHLAGYDNTAGSFSIQTNGVESTFTFAATGIATATPEPASLAILGGSLAALGMIRRRRAK